MNTDSQLTAKQIDRIARIRKQRKEKLRQEELKALQQLCRTDGEVEVPAVCYECGFEGKCLVVEGQDEDWLCLDCSCW